METCQTFDRYLHVLVPSRHCVGFSLHFILHCVTESPRQLLRHQSQPKRRSPTNRLWRIHRYSLGTSLQDIDWRHDHHCPWLRTRVLRVYTYDRNSWTKMDPDPRFPDGGSLLWVLRRWYNRQLRLRCALSSGYSCWKFPPFKQSVVHRLLRVPSILLQLRR